MLVRISDIIDPACHIVEVEKNPRREFPQGSFVLIVKISDSIFALPVALLKEIKTDWRYDTRLT
jgi:hypothetical protein